MYVTNLSYENKTLWDRVWTQMVANYIGKL